MALRPGGQMINGALPTRSQLLPLLTKYGELSTRTQMIPAILTIVVIMALFSLAGDSKPIVIPRGPNPMHWFYSSWYIIILGTFLVLLSLQFLYSLAGRAKSWMGLFGVMLFTMAFMQFGGFELIYPLFYGICGEPADTDTLLVSLWKHFVGTGFVEEITKAIPLLLLVLFASKLSPDQQRKFGIEEPLDGILLGAASAGGFVLIETIGDYVPTYLAKHWIAFCINTLHMGVPHNIGEATKLIRLGSEILGTSDGLQLLIPRALRSCFGHMAYAGYLGYFIGLSVLKPAKRWRILIVGLLSSAFLHALWDTVPGDLVKVAIAALCYGSLMAAILKAREISPNRSTLAPSVLFGLSNRAVSSTAVNPSVVTPGTGSFAGAAAAGAAGLLLPPFQTGAGALIPVPSIHTLRLGARQFTIAAGLRLSPEHAPGLQAQQPGGHVAEIIANPNDPTILGLANFSTSVWEAVSKSGKRYLIQLGQTVKLSAGTRIDFGTFDGEVY